jgi:hypothetical protein
MFTKSAAFVILFFNKKTALRKSKSISIFLDTMPHFFYLICIMYHSIISATKKEVRTMKIDHDYLFRLNNVLEKVKQAQLGLDRESRVEYRNMEIAIKEKIKEVNNILKKTTVEIVI